ncbi:hypothetical protein HYU82_02080 [Candidatus Saccharibacteria bacterium]|nr:hypothetical protein [Candidatus Saccharibacteria bacterium]MBI2285587.1 hypothetical protein [Candidatus Saccharibacteria bacterium]
MSLDYEGYDPNQVIEEADERHAEHMERAKRLDSGRQILELVAHNLSNEIDRASFFGYALRNIPVDVKELMDIVGGERTDPKGVVEKIILGADAVLAAGDHEAGIARAAEDTADFVQSRLDDDAAAEDAAARVENS